jgi:hypothetical protein
MNALSTLLYPALFFDGAGRMQKIQNKHELKLKVLASSGREGTAEGGTVLDSAGDLIRFNEVKRPAFRWLAAWSSDVKVAGIEIDALGMADAKQRVLAALTARFGHESNFGQPGTPVYQLLETIARAGSVASVVQAVPSSSPI